jgi:uncharacterized UPF0160 family protein
MKDQNEIQVAWEIWKIIYRLNDLIWDRYEDEFIQLCQKEESDRYWESLEEDIYKTHIKTPK